MSSAPRQKILGLPIGPPQKKSSTPKAVATGAALAVVPVLAARFIDKASGSIKKGQQVAHDATEASRTVNNLKQAADEHPGAIGKARAIASALKNDGAGSGKTKLSHLIEQHTDIAAPRSVVYNQWTQLEMFASITKGVENVEQDGRDSAEWTAKIGPSRRTWKAQITEQVPDERIAWRSKGGPTMKGVVSFHELDDELTRVLVEIDYQPSGAVEVIGNTLRIQRRRVKRDLRLFKHFVELRGEATGSWRGRIAKKDDEDEGDEAQEERAS